MDGPAFQTVAKSTLISSVTAGLSVGAFEAVQGRPAGPQAWSSAFNSGIVAATFFSVREYAVSPLLTSSIPWKQYETRRRTPNSGPPLSWSDLRTYNLLDTSISGALTGGFLNSIKRGRVGLVPGIATGAFACTLLQLVFNELGIARVKYVSRSPQSPTSTTTSGLQPQLPPESPKPLSGRILNFLGFHRMSDEEMLKSLKAKREHYLRQIETLEKGLAKDEEDAREDSTKFSNKS